MDPKMDSGYLAQGEVLEDDYDVLRPISLEETIGIMDELLCHEVSPRSPELENEAHSNTDTDDIDCLAHGTSALADSIHFTLH